MQARGLAKTSFDTVYQLARKEAFAGHYPEARLMCEFMLRDKPHFHDARVLYARTFAWDGKYGDAERILREVLQRAPHYGDAVTALADMALWQSQYDVVLDLIGREEQYNPKNVEMMLRKAKATLYSGKRPEAKAILDEIRKISPTYSEAIEFRAKRGL
jgi:tetratricopeptide (TPR) repeat protein